MLKKFRYDLFAIGYFAMGLFLAISLATFNPKDPSFNSIGHGLKTTNYCGVVGSFISDILFQFFGLTAWVFVLGAMKLTYDSFQGNLLSYKNIRILWGSLLILTLTSLSSLYFPNVQFFSNQIHVGGLLGLGLSKALISAFNYAGVQIVLWSAACVLIVFYSEKTIHELFQIPKHFYHKFTATAGRIHKSPLPVGLTKLFSFQFFKKPQRPAEAPTAIASNFPLIEPSFLTNTTEPIIESTTEQEEEAYVLPKRRIILKAKLPRRVENWDMPKLSLLDDPPATRVKLDKQEIQRKAELLTNKLKNFSIEGTIADAKPGPLVTMYEFKPNADVKISKISDLEDDLSLALSSESVRVVGHIPGRDVVGIETANLKRETVYYKDLIAEEKFWGEDFSLPMALGRQVDGDPKIVDLRRMPHLLVGGTTGSGKSVFVSSIITGLLFRHSPKTLRLILIDPKMVDLATFAGIPHLALPHITDARKAVTAFRWAVREMEKRYRSLSRFGASKIEIYNEKISKLSKEEIQEHETINAELEASGKGKAEQYYFQQLPYIVIVVDELADLMVTEKQNIEAPIQRLTQMARACGMHLILATQSPRKDVVTGLIKTNIPGRIALKVASKMDSRIILDDSGAERLLPNGDMLFLAPGINRPTRHHGPYLSDNEITNVVKFWSAQGEPEYDQGALSALESSLETSDGFTNSSESTENEYDEKYDEILSWASQQKEISASLIQRRFRLGYPRAARLIELFEKEGVVGPASGSKPRQVLVNSLREI